MSQRLTRATVKWYLAGAFALPLREAFLAINGTVSAGFEWDFAILFATRANSLVHFLRPTAEPTILKSHVLSFLFYDPQPALIILLRRSKEKNALNRLFRPATGHRPKGRRPLGLAIAVSTAGQPHGYFHGGGLYRQGCRGNRGGRG